MAGLGRRVHIAVVVAVSVALISQGFLSLVPLLQRVVPVSLPGMLSRTSSKPVVALPERASGWACSSTR